MKTTTMRADLDGPLVDYAAKGTRIELAGMEVAETAALVDPAGYT